MVAVIENRLVFGRDQVLTSTQASKNFGEVRRRARKEPQFVSDRNHGIDTVIIDFDEFEAMAVELEQLREEHLRSCAYARIVQADSNGDSKGIPIERVMGKDAYAALLKEESQSSAPDAELFE